MIKTGTVYWEGLLPITKLKTTEEVNDYLRAFKLMQRYEYRLSDQEWSELYLTVALAYSNLRDRRNAYDYASRSLNQGNHEAERIMNRNRP